MTSPSETFTSPVCPCKDCEDRTMTCHCVCGRYKNWKAYMERINAKKRLEKDGHTDREAMPYWRERRRVLKNKKKFKDNVER